MEDEWENVVKMYNTFERIATAPKDGRELLLYCKAKGAYVGMWLEDIQMWVPKYIDMEECETCSAFVPEPTYWCALPQKMHM